VRQHVAAGLPGAANARLTAIEPAGQRGPERPVYRVLLDLRRDGSPSNENDGQNVRWYALGRADRGRAVVEVASSPIAGE
jgi:hypothetical protein